MPAFICDHFGAPFLLINLINQALQPEAISWMNPAAGPTYLVGAPILFSRSKDEWERNEIGHKMFLISQDIPYNKAHNADEMYRDHFSTALFAKLYEKLRLVSVFTDPLFSKYINSHGNSYKNTFGIECTKLKSRRILIGKLFELGFYIKLHGINGEQTEKMYWKVFISVIYPFYLSDEEQKLFVGIAVNVTTNWTSSFETEFKQFETMKV